MDTRSQLIKLLGEKEKQGDLSYTVIRQETYELFQLWSLSVKLLADEVVEVQVTIPSNTQSDSYPVAVCAHSHGGNYELGKQEILDGNRYLAKEPYVESLSKLGFVTVSIDARGFGTRNQLSESELVKGALLYGKTLWGLMLFDISYLVDFIYHQSLFSFNSIGIMGMSMGALTSWWAAALDERLEWVIDIAGQVDLETLERQNGLNKHGHYYYVPSLLKFLKTSDIQQLIYPRHRLSLVGIEDANCPIEGVYHLDEYLKKVYCDYPERWCCRVSEGVHEETEEMRQQWIQFLERMKRK